MLQGIELDRPICFLDIETTGLDIKEDRIVEIYVKKIHPDKTTIEEFHHLVNPGDVEISEDALTIHGLTKEVLKKKPLFKGIAKELNEFLGDNHIGGYFVMKFDLPFIMEELYRNGITFNYKINNRKIIDVKNIYTKTNNPNSLNFAYTYFTGKTRTDEHSAKVDVDDSIEVLDKNLEALDSPDFDLIAEYSKISNSVDLSGKIQVKNNEFLLNFGKYYGTLVFDMFKNDMEYYIWIMGSDVIPLNSKLILKLLHSHWKQTNKKG